MIYGLGEANEVAKGAGMWITVSMAGKAGNCGLFNFKGKVIRRSPAFVKHVQGSVYRIWVGADELKKIMSGPVPLQSGATVPVNTASRAPMPAVALPPISPSVIAARPELCGLGATAIREAAAGLTGTPGYAGGDFARHIFSS